MNTNQKLITLERKATLSTLWIFFMLNMIMRDIHQLVKPGFLEEILSGVVNGNQVTDELLLLGGIMLQLPLGMILLSRVLPYRVNRWANVIAAAVTILLVIVNNTAPDLDDMLFVAVELTALLIIIWYAWK